MRRWDRLLGLYLEEVPSAWGQLGFDCTRGLSTEDSTHGVFLVNPSPDQAYKLWLNFKGLSRFMVHLKSVRELDARRSEWVGLGPGQREIR
jgi:hypothetical protein